MELIFYIVPAALFYAWVIGLDWLAIRPGQRITSRIAWGVIAAVPVAWYLSGFATGYRERGPWTRVAYLRSPRCLNAHTKGADAIALRRAQAAFVACAVADEVP